MARKTYDPNKVSVTVNLVPISGFADGEMIVVEYETDENSKHIGTGGEGRFIKSHDRSGTINIRLADYSTSNAALQLVRDLDVEVPITVTDKTSNADLFFTSGAKCQKLPNFVKGAKAQMNEWPFLFIKGIITHTGASEL